ncbi:MAG: phage integrase SAM-like domain-containing protein [Prevotella histicola]|uniref:site-specific integrase n=1 Tax=Prevotella histicola TaxID=470565 RepID=UPI001CB2BEB0|nr:site-specific integrase [Prevotella histicola]MBF1393867.1 phage integrase SAM-like domain-containing protein [Prevotella histicola]
MVTIKLYLDTRYSTDDNLTPLKMVFTHKRTTALLPLGVKLLPSQWDAKKQSVINHPQKEQINAFLLERRATISNILMRMTSDGELLGLSVTEVKNKVMEELSPKSDRSIMFLYRFEKYILQCKAERTKDIYQSTLNKVCAFDSNASSLRFEDISKEWLRRFDRWMADAHESSINTRSIHMRNIRAVFNDAIDNGITSAYPFRKFKIKNEATVKRALHVEELRRLFSMDVEPWMQRYVDCFKLSFMLIGINLADLLTLEKDSMHLDRLQYHRKKTHRLYDIKVERESMELIEKYKGRGRLLSWGEGRSSYRSFLMQMDKYLKRLNEGNDGSLNFSVPLTTYVARHSWASIAASIDIPIDTISHALGHGLGNRTTAIYIDFDMKKVDEANRKVLDWVLYEKR